MNCYEKFAHIYDKLINEDIDYGKWALKILDLCCTFNVEFKNYLDLACGTGNMTEKIAPHFQNSWAVDLSNEMLSEADKKLRNRGLKTNLICEDISNLKLNRQFDLITCCLDSTNYLLKEENLENYFEGVFSHLNPNGIFVFDINSYYKITSILGNNTYTYDEGELTYIWENYLQDEIVDMYLTFFVKYKDIYRRFDEHHRERAYRCNTIEKFLKNCKLSVLGKLDNYQTDSITDISERIVYVVKKYK
ncbi:class I SAM-dependent DNA methyltransferase [Clostridium sp. MT-14]|jgi:ubiquinone/menaquinone biosynthesis C-methylase UbiE|uniref:Class I SAM-dependent methyltransferase n=1 Tax=Clostridium aromativorans TaxID=2836848 RepID=A0ABS8N3C3_9CLOT|nr:class I SAM-dependent methyltransferase [Clostridium aromativorans]MCC9293328.1 class I SAM-dependent methyltransferase [Clostridium aromativorans]CAB1252061.1 dTDP-3-amino-3,4, 6-trideoxy-alpha-D-glucopyranose [Clostridiaceae bacterium BL-3]